MSGRWFRLYEDLLNDPKVQNLSPRLFKALINLWCVASRNSEKGGAFVESEVAFHLRMPVDNVKNLLTSLYDLGLLDQAENGLCPHNWGNRQFTSDISTTRTRAYRKRERKCDALDTESDTDTDIYSESKFLEFYAIFPKKVSKGAARKAYQSALKRGSHDEIVTGAKRYAASKPEPKYTKHPSTWLNQDCWLDELDPPKSATVLAGPWKKFAKEPPPKPMTPEEKARREAQIAKLRPGAIKQQLENSLEHEREKDGDQA